MKTENPFAQGKMLGAHISWLWERFYSKLGIGNLDLCFGFQQLQTPANIAITRHYGNFSSKHLDNTSLSTSDQNQNLLQEYIYYCCKLTFIKSIHWSIGLKARKTRLFLLFFFYLAGVRLIPVQITFFYGVWEKLRNAIWPLSVTE